MAEALLRVSHLTKEFPLSRHEALRAVSDVSFSLAPGEIFGLVGESGSGKSTLARTISGLYRPTAGQVFLEDLEISQPKIYARHRPRIAHTLQFLFQDSMASLNPRQPIGALIEEPLAIHHEGTRQSRRETALGLMAQVGLDAALYDQYPAEFSGGMRQRIMIAMALACNPELLIADEIAHQVMEPGMPAYRRIVEALGTDFLSEDGSIDRKALAKRLFGDGEALGTVNSIVHPTVWQAIEEGIRCSRKELVIVEAALFDEEHNGLFDQVWYIFTSEENRISRLMKSRGYSREKCLDIMRSQKSESEFRAMADRVIDNNKTVADVKRQIETILKEEAEA